MNLWPFVHSDSGQPDRVHARTRAPDAGEQSGPKAGRSCSGNSLSLL